MSGAYLPFNPTALTANEVVGLRILAALETIYGDDRPLKPGQMRASEGLRQWREWRLNGWRR